MKLTTVEPVPRLLWGDPECILLQLRLLYRWTNSNAAYMAEANKALVEQGRGAVETCDAQTFLAGLAEKGVVRIWNE